MIVMGKLEIFKDYIRTLSDLEWKRFAKVLVMYEELRPMTYYEVKKKIEEDKKLSASGRISMVQHNEYVFDVLVTSLGYLKTYKGVSLGDTVYVDGRKHSRVVHEFVVRDNEIFVILDDYKSALGTMVLFEFIRVIPRELGLSGVVRSNQDDALIDRLHFTEITSTIHRFFEMYADNELSFNPCYQRGLVWSKEQKELFIKALMKGITRLTPTYVFNGYSSNTKLYEVLDGKQRLNTLLEFVRSEFAVDGVYYKDWGYEDVRAFHRLPLVYTSIDGFEDGDLTLALRVELFLQLNSYGEAVDRAHLEMIKETYLQNEVEVKNE